MKYPKLFASSIYLFTFANIEIKPESTVVELNIPKRFTIKRDAKAEKQISNFTWPNFDDTQETFTNDDLLEVGYITFSTPWLNKTLETNKQDPAKGSELAYKELVEKGYKWQNDCWKMSNESAKARHSSTTTLARLAIFPSDDEILDIDPKYKLAVTVMLACFERSKTGNINFPKFNHTEKLMKKLGWDKESALRTLEKQHKIFPPINQTAS